MAGFSSLRMWRRALQELETAEAKEFPPQASTYSLVMSSLNKGARCVGAPAPCHLLGTPSAPVPIPGRTLRSYAPFPADPFRRCTLLCEHTFFRTHFVCVSYDLVAGRGVELVANTTRLVDIAKCWGVRETFCRRR